LQAVGILLTLPASLRGQGLMPVFLAKLLDRLKNFFYIFPYVIPLPNMVPGTSLGHSRPYMCLGFL